MTRIFVTTVSRVSGGVVPNSYFEPICQYKEESKPLLFFFFKVKWRF